MVVTFYLILFGMIVAVACAFLCASIASKKGYGYLAFFFVGLITGVIGLVVSVLIKDKDLRENGTADNLMKYSYLLQLGVISLEEFMWRKNKLVENVETRKDESQGIRNTAAVFATLSALLALLQILFLVLAAGSLGDFLSLLAQAPRIEGGSLFVATVILIILVAILCIVTSIASIAGCFGGGEGSRKAAFYLSLCSIGALFILVFFQFAFSGTTYQDTAYSVVSVACAFIAAKFVYDLPREEGYISELAYPQYTFERPYPMGPMMPMMPFGGASQPVIYLQQPQIHYGGDGTARPIDPAVGLPPQSSL